MRLLSERCQAFEMARLGGAPDKVLGSLMRTAMAVILRACVHRNQAQASTAVIHP
jgi:hypothetical protein